MLQAKTIILGVGGGPLTSTAIEVLRALQRAGAGVRVVLSAETEAFVPALTFRSLADGDVLMPGDLYGRMGAQDFHSLHALVRNADGLVVVPATLALIAKAAAGLADEALVRAMLLHNGPAVFACAARAAEYQHPLVRQNVQRLRDAGVTLCDAGVPETDDSEDELGWRMASATVVEAVAASLRQTTVLSGKTVIVTAGPTQEPIDPVRHISNASSGKTGFAIAEAARQRGAEVVLITGPTHLQAPVGVTCVPVRTAVQMRDAVREHFAAADVVIKSAAVSDFRPATVIADKVKKEDATLSIALERNPDILAELGAAKGKRVLVGFAAETRDLLANAKQKVSKKALDLIVANDVSDPAMGFASDHNRVHLIDAAGRIEPLPVMSKRALAEAILDRVQAVLAQRQGGGA
jgi:phosphopantothenoylcysteine decarboxylase/phosphopantothenate--cysteine ligase